MLLMTSLFVAPPLFYSLQFAANETRRRPNTVWTPQTETDGIRALNQEHRNTLQHKPRCLHPAAPSADAEGERTPRGLKNESNSRAQRSIKSSRGGDDCCANPSISERITAATGKNQPHKKGGGERARREGGRGGRSRRGDEGDR